MATLDIAKISIFKDNGNTRHHPALLLHPRHNPRIVKGFPRTGPRPGGHRPERLGGFPVLIPGLHLAETLCQYFGDDAEKLLTKVAELAMLGWLDKTLGLVFALAVNALVIGVFIVLFDTINAKFALVKPEVLDASIVYSSLRDLSYLVFPYLKSFFFKQ